MANDRRNALIIGRVGDASLHRSWLSCAPGTERSFDLHLSYYGQSPSPFNDLPDDVTISHEPGPKFSGLHACLDKLDERLSRYRWICFVDDDVWAQCETWNKFFSIVDELQPLLAQPALKRGSFYSHDITLERFQFIARWTNFVEIMNFCFRLDFLQQMRPSFLFNQSGWGLDYYWSEHAQPKERSIAIIDAAPVLHTKAVGRGGLYDVLKGGRDAARNDRIALAEEKMIPRSYAGILKNGVTSHDPSLNASPIIPRQVKKLRKLFNILQIAPPHPQ